MPRTNATSPSLSKHQERLGRAVIDRKRSEVSEASSTSKLRGLNSFGFKRMLASRPRTATDLTRRNAPSTRQDSADCSQQTYRKETIRLRYGINESPFYVPRDDTCKVPFGQEIRYQVALTIEYRSSLSGFDVHVLRSTGRQKICYADRYTDQTTRQISK